MGRTIAGAVMAICGVVMYEFGGEAAGIVWIVMGANMITTKE